MEGAARDSGVRKMVVFTGTGVVRFGESSEGSGDGVNTHGCATVLLFTLYTESFVAVPTGCVGPVSVV